MNIYWGTLICPLGAGVDNEGDVGARSDGEGDDEMLV